MRMDHNRPSVQPEADFDRAVLVNGAEGLDAARDEALDQFPNARAARPSGDQVGLVLDRRQRIGDGDRKAARLHESMVVLGVADGHDIVGGQAEIVERRLQAARLVDAGWQDHHRALVEDDLQFEPEVPNCFEHGFLIGFPSRDNGAADRQRSDALRAQPLDESFGRLGRQRLFLPGRRVVEERAVFRDDAVEEIEAGKAAGEVRQLPAGDENELSAGAFEVDQRFNGRRVNDAVVGQSAVVVRCETDDVHCHSHSSTRTRTSRFRRAANGGCFAAVAKAGLKASSMCRPMIMIQRCCPPSRRPRTDGGGAVQPASRQRTRLSLSSPSFRMQNDSEFCSPEEKLCRSVTAVTAQCVLECFGPIKVVRDCATRMLGVMRDAVVAECENVGVR